MNIQTTHSCDIFQSHKMNIVIFKNTNCSQLISTVWTVLAYLYPYKYIYMFMFVPYPNIISYIMYYDAILVNYATLTGWLTSVHRLVSWFNIIIFLHKIKSFYGIPL